MPTSSRRSIALSEFSQGRWAAEPSNEPPLHPTELERVRRMRPARVRRALLALAGFLIAICMGVAATLSWLSYGNAVRGTIASLSPRLAWLAPQPARVADAAPALSANASNASLAASASASPDQLVAISRSLAAVRQSVDKLAADISRLQATKQDAAGPDIRISRTSAPPPPAVSIAGRKPAPPTSLSQAPQVR
jgi:hypothetical protein